MIPVDATLEGYNQCMGELPVTISVNIDFTGDAMSEVVERPHDVMSIMLPVKWHYVHCPHQSEDLTLYVRSIDPMMPLMYNNVCGYNEESKRWGVRYLHDLPRIEGLTSMVICISSLSERATSRK